MWKLYLFKLFPVNFVLNQYNEKSTYCNISLRPGAGKVGIVETTGCRCCIGGDCCELLSSVGISYLKYAIAYELYNIKTYVRSNDKTKRSAVWSEREGRMEALKMKPGWFEGQLLINGKKLKQIDKFP